MGTQKKKQKERIEKVDGLLTIGRTYDWFDCGSKETCAIPFRQRDDEHCFVHEAEWRGVSRKVGGVPKWVIPGITRVFLAYPGGATTKNRVCVYGYFVLSRVEVIASYSAAISLSDQMKSKRLESVGSCRIEGTLYDSKTGTIIKNGHVSIESAISKGQVKGLKKRQRIRQGKYRIELPPGKYSLSLSGPGYQTLDMVRVSLDTGSRNKLSHFLDPAEPHQPKVMERKRKCPDGTEIVTHRFSDGRWERTNEKCEPEGPEPCVEGDTEIQVCPDGSIIVTQVCYQGEWVSTGASCPKSMPPDIENLCPERSCSLRSRPRAVYLVDALAAEVADAFRLDLEFFRVDSEYRRGASLSRRRNADTIAREMFIATVESIRGRRLRKTQIPGKLHGKAHIRGELVLFNKPPLLDVRPRRVFRSLTYIDGDHLIDQVVEGKSSVRVVFTEPGIKDLRPSPRTVSLTKKEICTRLANQQGLNHAVANRFLEHLYRLAKEELKQGRPFRIPHIGTFRRRRSGTSFAMSKRMNGEKKKPKTARRRKNK